MDIEKKQRRERVKNIVRSLNRYMGTYHQQRLYEDYTDKTIIDDVLYGLGIALNPDEYKFASGYDKFKKVLIEHLQSKTIRHIGLTNTNE